MQFTYYAHTDIGRRKVNQDSSCILEAETECGQILLAAVCDGMGGLKHGEIASSVAAEELTNWFYEDLPDIVYGDSGEDLEDLIFTGLKRAALRADKRIYDFSEKEGQRCGTTMVVLLFLNNNYYTMNIGDSRAYLLRKRLHRLTKDQTKAQELVDRNAITEEEAREHKASSILTQCVGVHSLIVPEHRKGILMDNDIFLLCSDGFRHKLSDKEIEHALKEEDPKTRTEFKNMAGYLTEENKNRGENDNITSVYIRVAL